MIEAVWANFDKDADGNLNRNESQALISDLIGGSRISYTNEEFVDLFKKLDTQGNGFVNK